MMVSIVGAAPFVYVTNSGDNTVSVIDTATNTVTATVKVGYYPDGIAVSPDRTRVYVTNYNSNTTSVIDTASNMVIATITGFYHPSAVAASPDGKTVYVQNQGYTEEHVDENGTIVNNLIDGKFSIIDASTNKITDTLDTGYNTKGFALTPDGEKLYVGSGISFFGEGTKIYKYDITTKKCIANISIAGYQGFPTNFLTSTDGKAVYVATPLSYRKQMPYPPNTWQTYYKGLFSICDIATNNVTYSKILIGETQSSEILFYGIAASPDGKKVYVAKGSRGITIIDLSTYNVTDFNQKASAVAVSQDSTKLYVTYDDNVTIIDTNTFAIVAKVPVGKYPKNIVIVTVSAAPAAPLSAQYVSDTIPTTMTAGQSYPVSVTMRNNGMSTWNSTSKVRLGGVGDGSGDASKFGPTRINIATGTNVAPNASYTFNFIMTAPTAGTYNPKYKMVKEGVTWFGQQLSKTVSVK
jgi:YVTN family beta-propeller protein